MRIKSILSLIAFAAAFAFSVALAALTTDGSSNAAQPQTFKLQTDEAVRWKITRFLERDIENGHRRDRSVYGFEDYSMSSPNIFKRAEAVKDYSDESGAMDFDRMPQDFQLAWLKHMRAWHNYSDFLQKARTEKMRYSEIRRMEDQYNREINSTWYQVLSVGRSYGATIVDN